MTASQYRSQLERKRKQYAEAAKKAGDFRSKESGKRTDASKARQAASRTNNASAARAKQNESDRREKEAESAGKEASRWQAKVTALLKEINSLETKLLKAERAEADAAERRRVREQQLATRRAASDQAALEQRVAGAEASVQQALRQLPAPRQEKLRILILGSSSEGDLRVGREQKRIRAAIESSLHRDLVELDVRPAATPADLLDGITKFRPHIVHFSGHSDSDFITFEDEVDGLHEGLSVRASAFAKTLRATDQPPLLVLLNSCNSATQTRAIVDATAPFAIGMTDEVRDGDAIAYAAQFYASLANGQSVRSSHLAGQAALELAGLTGADLPQLAWAADVDPAAAVLVSGHAG
ncbi:hypothetical protein [Curtobacterium sp. MCPF17_052]|uniref:hypothetical protein n=1 Tax=Curtobacterium sp. MCPF17_052 TaxID=2175655 RepID=UPI000DAA42C2|nr:hypothetical protein [Curtobacterium sp. MCPF17_052]WIB13303.1 hypothetical protein DEJ36_05510 [Curtobacterium sp. MCPF17_052]